MNKKKNNRQAAPPEKTPEKKGSVWFENTVYFALISIIFLASYSYTFDKKLDLNGDNAYYYVLAKALSQGEGYVNIASIEKGPNNHFPPGYPFIMSLFMHFSDSVVFLKMLNGLFLLISLYLIFYLVRHLTGNLKMAFIAVLFITLNADILQYSTILMTEIPFILFSTTCLIFVYKIDFGKTWYKDPYIYLALTSLAISYYIRSTGLALFGGIILYLAFKKQWKHALFIFTGFIALALPWIIRSQRLGGSSYIKPLVMINPYRPELGNAELIDYFNRFFSNLSRYITREIPSSVFSFINVNYFEEISFNEWLLGLVMVAVGIYGFYKIWRKGLLIICYLLGTFAILLLWPDVWKGVRFVLPVMPFLLMALLTGIYYLVAGVLEQMKFKMKFNLLILALFALAYIRPINQLHLKAKEDYPANWKNYFKIAEYFDREKIQDVVVICRKPMLFHLKSGTYTAVYPYTSDPDEMLADFRENKVDYVVLDNLGYGQTYQYLFPVIRDNPDKFPPVLILSNPDTYLFRFAPEN